MGKKKDKQKLPLDQQYTNEAYAQAADKYRQLGFTDFNSMRYGVSDVLNNGDIQLDGGQLPEVTVVGTVPRQTAQQLYDDWQAYRAEQRQKEEQAAQADMNNYIRQGTDKWGRAIGLGMAAAAALPVVSSMGSAAYAYLSTPAGMASFQSALGELAGSIGGYMAVDGASKLVTGKTFGQNIADTMGYIPGVKNIPYQQRELMGSMLNPGAYWTMSPRLVAGAVKGFDSLGTAAEAGKYAIKSNALAYGSALSSMHPKAAGKVLKVADKFNPGIRQSVNDYTMISFPDAWDWNIVNGVYSPIMPSYVQGEKHFSTVAGRAFRNKELNRAIRERRYTPLMSVSDKKNYIRETRKVADEALDYVIDLNRYSDNLAAQEELALHQSRYSLSPEYRDQLMKLDDALREAESLRISAGSMEFRDIASKHGLSEDDLRNVMYKSPMWNNRAWIDQRLRQGKAAATMDNSSFLSLNGDIQRPVLRLVHKTDPDRTWNGQFYMENGTPRVNLVMRLEKAWGNPNGTILRPMSHNTSMISTRGILAHESDHYMQKLLPKVKISTTSSYLRSPEAHPITLEPQKPYFHINGANNNLQNAFPAWQQAPYVKWKSSPHEWRSELVGNAFNHGYPADISTWTPQQIKVNKGYLNWRFSEYNDVLKQKGIALPDIGTLTHQMYHLGYKDGGKLNYLNYSK